MHFELLVVKTAFVSRIVTGQTVVVRLTGTAEIMSPRCGPKKVLDKRRCGKYQRVVRI